MRTKYVYIYIYHMFLREREREREIYIYMSRYLSAGLDRKILTLYGRVTRTDQRIQEAGSI